MRATSRLADVGPTADLASRVAALEALASSQAAEIAALKAALPPRKTHVLKPEERLLLEGITTANGAKVFAVKELMAHDVSRRGDLSARVAACGISSNKGFGRRLLKWSTHHIVGWTIRHVGGCDLGALWSVTRTDMTFLTLQSQVQRPRTRRSVVR